MSLKTVTMSLKYYVLEAAGAGIGVVAVVAGATEGLLSGSILNNLIDYTRQICLKS